MSGNTPIEAETGKHCYVAFRVRQNGKPRNLKEHSDQVSFIVTREDSTVPVISKQSGSGISQDESGWGQITLTPTDLQRNKFQPGYRYEYDLEVTEGDTGLQWPLMHGPFKIQLTAQ